MANLDDVVDELRELNATLHALQIDILEIQTALSGIEMHTGDIGEVASTLSSIEMNTSHLELGDA